MKGEAVGSGECLRIVGSLRLLMHVDSMWVSIITCGISLVPMPHL